ncbi:50S ribosomal protein L9 [Spiroplasma turonicum]|uniref:Large ribosomal subunit protein bL9 n=1 Tax=Spiroplasma turonicum TaxID=216946 RepID=A0A0K1P4P1_9MOLU|nr:50S ribosomal protein L9 [Spiroplasma turonicum]AKU79270.1 50S ribosomal protein L9 [Spiroplasma turonicum]ALX70293.1 50S ribosomal protein L9 [Spiroplasma turonicum]
MKVILLENLKNYGKKNDVVEVSDGYAKNYLIPKKLAKVASKNELGHLNVIKNKEQEYQKLENEKITKIIEYIKDITLKFTLKLNDNKAFGTVSLNQIVDVLSKSYNLDIDKKKFEKHEVLNKVGLYYLKIKLAKDRIATLKVEIEGKN